MNKIFLFLFVLVILLVGGFILYRGSLSTTSSASSTPQTSPDQSSPPSSANVTQIPTQNSVIVTLTPTGFSPQTVTIKAGDTVMWINSSGQPATVNSNNHPTHLLYPPLNLGQFDDGQSLSLIFPTPGTYGYHNHLSPSQMGTVVVQ